MLDEKLLVGCQRVDREEEPIEGRLIRADRDEDHRAEKMLPRYV